MAAIALLSAACTNSPVAPSVSALPSDEGGSVQATANSHWILDSTGCNTSGDPITCWFKVAGLGKNQGITITLSVDAQIQFSCRNPGGQDPPPWQNLRRTLSDSATLTSGKNGQVTGSLSVSGSNASPPAASDVCPNGNWTVVDWHVVEGTASLSSPGLPTLNY